MTLRTDQCNFRQVSDMGRKLVNDADPQALVEFTRQTLSCPCLRQCPSGDYCTIFSASLLSERGRRLGQCHEG